MVKGFENNQSDDIIAYVGYIVLRHALLLGFVLLSFYIIFNVSIEILYSLKLQV